METKGSIDAAACSAPQPGRRVALAAMGTLFFMWGFCTVLNDVLAPHLKAVFQMTYFQTMLIQFAFFSGYLMFSLPSARLLSFVGYQRACVIGLLVMGGGCLILVPAAHVPSYGVYLCGVFTLAAGMTVLQVAANPYMALLGAERTASARLNLAQGVNSVGTLLAPLFGGAVILSQTQFGRSHTAIAQTFAERAADARVVELPYLGIAGVLILLAIVFGFLRLPDLRVGSVRGTGNWKLLLRNKRLVMGVLAIFVYVGAEVSIGSFLINYITSTHVSHMSAANASTYLSAYWGGAMIGRFALGALMLRFAAPAKILADNCVMAILLIAISMLFGGASAMWAMLLIGLCNSIMFPTIFTLAIRGLGPLTDIASGWLVAAIFGGAVIPLLQALVADQINLTASFVVPAICYGYIWWFALRSFETSDGDARRPAIGNR